MKRARKAPELNQSIQIVGESWNKSDMVVVKTRAGSVQMNGTPLIVTDHSDQYYYNPGCTTTRCSQLTRNNATLYHKGARSKSDEEDEVAGTVLSSPPEGPVVSSRKGFQLKSNNFTAECYDSVVSYQVTKLCTSPLSKTRPQPTPHTAARDDAGYFEGIRRK
ncbi:hypothetical protein FA15DRAFT_454716 [Coprinopsis marcescibilis]|uniref:Uncharacterized protein n=1 Tax=Coprinopsis marcescibilis TaxID=230819 RepID=A0A5C3L7F7_COPMA|nr:hypothetical protein FA15DRAFT_454716 [Coprinopsis marcescibilis]